MIVIPCSIKTLSGLCYSYASNLLLRAGDVTLKERKPLILVARETPLHRGHLQAMLQLTEMGAIIMPPVPTFYHKPKTIDDIINHTVSRVLDLVDLDPNISPRWSGLPE
jgi:4-hydroxy-3-polyprenylbenzoate decarboxylase